jgi:hypothetical protein
MSPAGPPGQGKPGVRIDRLALRVAGLDEGAARALARLVAERLADGALRPAGSADLDHLRIEVTASAAERARQDLLARRIVSELGHALGEAIS